MIKPQAFPYISDECPMDTAIEAAQQHLDRLQCLPVVAVCIPDPNDYHDHLRTLQHWFASGIFWVKTAFLSVTTEATGAQCCIGQMTFKTCKAAIANSPEQCPLKAIRAPTSPQASKLRGR